MVSWAAPLILSRAPRCSSPTCGWCGGRQGCGLQPDLWSPALLPSGVGQGGGPGSFGTQQAFSLCRLGVCLASGPSPKWGGGLPRCHASHPCGCVSVPPLVLCGAPGVLRVACQMPEAERWCRFPLPAVSPLGSLLWWWRAPRAAAGGQSEAQHATATVAVCRRNRSIEVSV